jgi:hypothetical protein
MQIPVLAGVMSMINQPESTAHLLAAWDAALERLGAVVLPSDKPEHDRHIGTVRSQLGDTTFENYLERRFTMTLENALAREHQEL